MAYEARTDEGSKAAFGASEMCCYLYPEDTALDKGRRAAFMDGAAWAADEIERLRHECVQSMIEIGNLRADLDSMQRQLSE